MSELIEINEDNCVLDMKELCLIDTAFNTAQRFAKLKDISEQDARELLLKIFLKITKLNDLVKQTKEEQK